MTDRRGLSIIYRVLCFTVKLIETEYNLGKTRQAPCCRCDQGKQVTPVVIIKS